jgi:hypothetical protein
MTKIGVSISINVSKIEKARLYQGKKGKYLDLTTFIDIDNKDQYDNNGFIAQNVSKEEKEQGVKGPILGNCKVFYNDSQTQQPQQNQGRQSPQLPQGQTPSDDFDDTDIPF